ncbi:MAG: hypothetical protein ISR65_17400 [Bacteriovoracaceae bacterium]|nr:hypothetical protein [Bacteriovoracaceae bacterium]
MSNKLETIDKSKLVEALLCSVEKCIQLRNSLKWEREVRSDTPPVLWFGNLNSGKEVVLTLGANPSINEYQRNKSSGQLMMDGYERLRTLKGSESYEQVLNDKKLQDEILDGYNDYFKNNPYKAWFGDTEKVEGVLRGADASYYMNSNKRFQGVHIDFFPFATKSNYKDIKSIIEKDLFENGNWSRLLLVDLIKAIKPKFLILIGDTNRTDFAKYFFPNLSFENHKNFYWGFEDYLELNIYGSDYYYPNCSMGNASVCGQKILEHYLRL